MTMPSTPLLFVRRYLLSLALFCRWHSAVLGTETNAPPPFLSVTPEQRLLAEKSLRQKIDELNSATNSTPAATLYPSPTQKTNVFPVTRRITALPGRPDSDPLKDPREALQRRTKSVPITNGPVFEIKRYEVKGVPALPTNSLPSLLSKYTGANI